MHKVSCILATKDRPEFLNQAIQYFQRQTYPDRELIIVDDSVIASQQVPIFDSRIKYIHLSRAATLGEKLNIAVQCSSGSLIQKIDDDDYYHHDFLTRMVDKISQQNDPQSIAAVSRFLVFIVGNQNLYDSGPGWFAGGTYCFSRQVWLQGPFRDVPRRVDVFFLEDHPESVRVPVDDPELYMLVRHGRHTWTTLVPEVVIPADRPLCNSVEEHFLRCNRYEKPLSQLVEASDLNFYQNLAGRLSIPNLLDM